MERQFPHVLRFHCANLSAKNHRRIQSYFQVRRKSGGGECGEVTQVGPDVFGIGFREEEVKQRVLERSKHVVEVPGGTLVLTLLDASSSADASNRDASVRPKLKPTASSQKPNQLPPPASPPPTGNEHELHLESYVIRYLKETPDAQKDLEDKLASLACSAPRYLDEETVLVASLSHSGAESGNWKQKVDEVFEGYSCHFEFDSRKVKALLCSHGSNLKSDRVKVYSEVGMTVVVGECSQVNDKLKDVAESLAKHQDVNEKQTSVRHLGEAKLRLLWSEMEGSLREYFPDVEVKRGDPGQLVLSGSGEEVLKASRMISDKDNSVLERIISDKSPHFLAFLRKVYGTPGVLENLFGVGGQVEIELGETELHLFSLSAEKLDHTEKKMEETFMDVKIDVPNCSLAPTELLEKLKSKCNELNQGGCRVQIVSGLDCTIWFLGHSEEVQELSESVTEFILDQASVEGKIRLPFPELLHLLPDLLRLHDFDHSGVTLIQLASNSGPLAVLEGPSSKVSEVRNRLGPLLDSLVQERIAIDLPGAVRYFESDAGRDGMLRVARAQKSLAWLEQQPIVCRQSSGVTKYVLQDGLQVLVCQGDITKQYADVLVNAANDKLEHSGGVAAALSKAAGPEIQKESRDIVRKMGRIPTGDAVMTTGGNLKCKKVVHTVGPVMGNVGGNERALVEKAVQSALHLAEKEAFKSIAIPCISSGIYHVPLAVCAEGIVTAVKMFSSRGGRSVNRIILIDQRAEVVQALQDACDRLLKATRIGCPNRAAFQDAVGGASAGAAGARVHVQVVPGAIQTQQVDVLVSAMVGLNPESTRVGHDLSAMVGRELKTKFAKAAAANLHPGDTVVLENLPGLKSKAVIFIWLTPWDNNQRPVQVLREGIRKTLASCESRGFTSVAFPSLGVGAVLGFPPSVAFKALQEEINAFDQKRVSQVPFKVRVVIQAKTNDSRKEFQSALETFCPSGLATKVDPAISEESFYSHISTRTDMVTAMMGKVKLQIVNGDMLNAGTDVIVNSTDFSNYQSGVSKAILTAAGPTVMAEFSKAGIPENLMCSTGPGLLGCKEIVHASFKNDSETIRKHCKRILEQCERQRHQSVAFPAINTGQAGMNAAKSCKAMLDGMTAAVRDMDPRFLSLIRIVILQQSIFNVFKAELESRFGQSAPRQHGLRDRAKQLLEKCRRRSSKGSVFCATGTQAFVPSKPQPAKVGVISCGPDIVQVIQTDLENLLRKQLVERAVEVENISRLDAMELDAVQAKVSVQGIGVESNKGQGPKDVLVYVLKGLKEDVLSILDLVNRSVQKVLSQDLRDREEAMLALTVQWAVQDGGGVWQELSLHDNYAMEEARCANRNSVKVTGPQGNLVEVELKTLQAVDLVTGFKYRVKRSESEAGLELPSHWEAMHGEVFKKVALQPNSKEYRDVAEGFRRTAKNAIKTIERVQNVYLWHAFGVCKQRIIAKNGAANLGEKILYHGTSAESCNCIERDRFDRSYAGAHAAIYGKGVYFAVNASYSAGRYSPADASGLKRLYVSRVLTGRYTVGKSSMKAPPPRASDPTDCYDSLVDNQQNPSMFIVFHDDQAYPEYCVTFT